MDETAAALNRVATALEEIGKRLGSIDQSITHEIVGNALQQISSGEVRVTEWPDTPLR